MTTTNAHTIIARVPTANGSRYLQQLCKHWSHRLDVTFDPNHGEIKFEQARCLMDAEAEVLVVTLTVDDAREADRMQGVVSSHLDRFAFREAPLAFDWQPAS